MPTPMQRSRPRSGACRYSATTETRLPLADLRTALRATRVASGRVGRDRREQERVPARNREPLDAALLCPIWARAEWIVFATAAPRVESRVRVRMST
jgi:hypothetical protein